jgi:hypothetical protein
MSGLSRSQQQCAREIKGLMTREGFTDPHQLSRSDLAAVHRGCYEHLAEADSRTVSAYVCSNLRSKHFLKAVGADDEAQLRGLDEKLRKLEAEVQEIRAAVDDLLGK